MPTTAAAGNPGSANNANGQGRNNAGTGPQMPPGANEFIQQLFQNLAPNNASIRIQFGGPNLANFKLVFFLFVLYNYNSLSVWAIMLSVMEILMLSLLKFLINLMVVMISGLLKNNFYTFQESKS